MTEMDTIVSLAKRRGFVFQSSEIYGGLASTYDYGPLGVELKRNIRESWWNHYISQREDVVGIDSAILMAPSVWEASGHVQGFSDPLVECNNCNQRFRLDHLENQKICPNPSCKDQPLSPPRQFNLMFKTFLGPVEDSAAQAYLRPETAQGIFVNFQNVQTTTRKKIPFGIGQIGKSFRNEITVGNFLFRTREFEQMEMEFFVKPGSDEEWHEKWINYSLEWYDKLGISREKIQVRAHDKDELSHYSKATSDIEYLFPWGWGELQGIANRTDFDLKAHTTHSGVRLDYFDQENNEHFTPYVIEPAVGVDRIFLTLLIDAYREEEINDGKEKRVVLKLAPQIAPIQIAVLPLSKNERLVPKAREIFTLLNQHYSCEYDDAQSIGRRYRRQDEIGTPLCITIDFDTIEKDNNVTIRDRDTMKQIRVPLTGLLEHIQKTML
jgi:glycyl-tRNA synthetase